MKVVYRYGLRAPYGHQPSNPLDVEHCGCPVCQQLRLAHEYGNTLVEIERGRRAAVRALHAEFGDTAALEEAVAHADEACERVVREIKRARAKLYTENIRKGATPGAARKGARVTPPELAKELATARGQKRAAGEKLAMHRRQLREDPRVIVGESEIEGRAKELSKSAREHSRVYWGTYLGVERAHAASIASLPLYDGPLPNDPRFDRYRGEGTLGVQIQRQKGDPAFTVEMLVGEDTRVQLRPLGQAGHEHTRNQRDADGRVVRGGPFVDVRQENRMVRRQEAVRETYVLQDGETLRLRIGSDGRAPIWAEWPLKWNRPLPKGAIVSWVTVTKRMIALREEWTVEFTLDLVETVAQKPEDSEKIVALDLGWRMIDDEMRVAAWRSKDGRHGDFRLPSDLLTVLRKADETRGRRDKEFDQARERLADWLGKTEAVPEWLQVGTKTLRAWKSPARLVSLVKRWHRARFEGDAEVFQALEAWRYHEHHLWLAEASMRTSAHRWRDDLYRGWGKVLAVDHDVLVVEEFDIRNVARKHRVDEKPLAVAGTGNRHLGAPGRLRLTFKEACARYGCNVVTMRSSDTTRTCHVCGLIEEFDAARSVIRATPCSGCGARWDQDDNACIELLARYDLDRERAARERAREEAEGGAARKEEKEKKIEDVGGGRWARAREKRAAKQLRVQGAREMLAKMAEGLGSGETGQKGSATP